ncbi:RlpA-like double-psi beta-barrel domain-containing protein [Streptomyces sp. NPDC004667]|uniref:RlpA-like double-psi beta-barrel domain-containing protein n=1 Tax=Streptomyces sp. NPDC004667 TaxID=3154285 RepID=UPI0033A8E474
MRARIAKTAVAALLAAGPAAVITAATATASASASEDTGTTISAASASEQQDDAASPETELPLSPLAPQPGKTTPAPPKPQPGKTTTAPPKPKPGKTTAAPPKPKPGKTTAAPPKPQPGKTTAAPPKPQPGKTTAAPPKPKPKPGKGYEGPADFFHGNGVDGTCGQRINDGDFVAALDPTMFGMGDPAPHCGKKVIVTYEGKSIVATVLDASPTAQRRGLDLTPAAFTALAPLDRGTINVTWRFAE